MSDTKFVAESYTNEFGQVLNPGDAVMYVGMGRGGQISTKQGTFEGVYYSNVYNWKDRKAEIKITGLRVGGVAAKRFIYDWNTKSGYHEDYVRKAVLPRKRVYKLEIPK